MKELLKKIQELKNSEIKKTIDSRIKEFEEIGKDPEKIFQELCFCILTANYNAKRAIKIQDKINDFSTLSKETLSKKLNELGHRFPNKRAEYICLASQKKKELLKVLDSLSGKELREWLVDNIKGLGYKESSHFLRNIGYKNLAIIDFHIVDLLVSHGLIEKPKTLTKKKYLEIEEVLQKIAKKANLTLAELDLYLWYIETGKILK
ncbi:MAG: N-glycosylase/DNA lyase [Candidatus Aenigmatarchaeota archaeon]